MANKHIPAGGIHSNKRVDVSMRTGGGVHAKSPAGVSQIGSAVAPQSVEPVDAGRGFKPVPFGNEVAKNVGSGGPGTGRTLYGQGGTQGTHGPVAQGEADRAPDVPVRIAPCSGASTGTRRGPPSPTPPATRWPVMWCSCRR
jgi:hypothetical protein